jgi:hypothetical protein
MDLARYITLDIVGTSFSVVKAKFASKLCLLCTITTALQCTHIISKMIPEQYVSNSAIVKILYNNYCSGGFRRENQTDA